MDEELRLIALRHPLFTQYTNDWELWRTVYEGGSKFIDTHLERFSKREESADFEQRKKLTYNPGFAACALDEVKNAVYGRMPDITRVGGSPSYQMAITGAEGGVDLTGSSMNYYIGQKVLPEMLAMTRVGVYVDMPPVEGRTILDAKRAKVRPYIYRYQAEEILNWQLDLSSSRNEYSSILLQESYDTWDTRWNMASGSAIRIRYMYKDAEGVHCLFFDLEGYRLDMLGNRIESAHYLLPNMKRIPFVLYEIPSSLLKNTAKYDVAMLNVASSDINYAVKANFPLYVEQQDSRATNPNAQKDANGSDKEIPVGSASGRAYGQGLNEPNFIHPSPEPLKASMEKQEQMKRDIRLLTHLALTNMTPTKQQSAESKGLDNQGLEAGLAFIGMQLERGERLIAEYWAEYENSTPATVTYPTQYNLKSDAERRDEVDHQTEILPKIPSLLFQKEVGKQIARNVVGHRVSREVMTNIEKEIDKAPFMISDPINTIADVTAGVLSKEDCAKVRCYPATTVETANKEHAARLAEIAKSQAPTNGAARGVADTGADPKAGSKERAAARNSDTSRTSNGGDRTRGPGK